MNEPCSECSGSGLDLDIDGTVLGRCRVCKGSRIEPADGDGA